MRRNAGLLGRNRDDVRQNPLENASFLGDERHVLHGESTSEGIESRPALVC